MFDKLDFVLYCYNLTPESSLGLQFLVNVLASMFENFLTVDSVHAVTCFFRTCSYTIGPSRSFVNCFIKNNNRQLNFDLKCLLKEHVHACKQLYIL